MDDYVFDSKRNRKWFHRLNHVAKSVSYLATFMRRRFLAREDFKPKNDGPYAGARLTKAQKAAVRQMWGWTGVNGKWMAFYNAVKREEVGGFDARYVPLDLQNCIMYDWFNNAEATRVLADKNLFDMLFHDARQPKTIVRRLYGRYMDDRYAALTFEEAVRRCREQKSVIVKPTVKASSGVGIVFWSEEEGEEALLPLLKGGDNFVVQEVVRQHPALAALHKESVNTIRMMTCYFEGEMSVLSSIVRIGVGSARVDNASQGALSVALKRTEASENTPTTCRATPLKGIRKARRLRGAACLALSAVRHW